VLRRAEGESHRILRRDGNAIHSKAMTHNWYRCKFFSIFFIDPHGILM
jgi:hypothetical protein